MGLLFRDTRTMCRAAEEQARVTHLDPRCAAGSVVIARAVALAAQRRPLDAGDFIEDLATCAETCHSSMAAAVRGLNDWVPFPPIRAARHLHALGLDPVHNSTWQGISAFVIPSVLWSLYSFLRSPDDYWETICIAIGVGGDSDTMAAMAGAISGARVGVEALPSGLLERINDRGEWGAPALADLARACGRISGA
jgi:ADP-ribosylglycohydrolase